MLNNNIENVKQNKTEFKGIRLTPEQSKNWNPKLVSEYLGNPNKLLRELYELMSNKMEFKEKPNELDMELIEKIEEIL